MSDPSAKGRLTVQLSPPTQELPPPGTSRLALSRGSALLHLPPLDSPEFPLLVLLHGAGGSSSHMVQMVSPSSDPLGIALLAPQSTAPSWDVVRGGYGPDVRLLDEALGRLFQSVPVDASRLGIAGFSDGASYALCLGLANGDLFQSVLAWSPGFAAPKEVNGSPSLFISHGRADAVLPIDKCGRPLASRLKKQGYDLLYQEFQGPHLVPPSLLDLSLRRFLGLPVPA